MKLLLVLLTVKTNSYPTKRSSRGSEESFFIMAAFKNDSNHKKRKVEETASNSKRALKQARQSHRPHSETVVTAKELWNKLRLKTNTPAKNEELMKELMGLLTGKFNQVALQHDASRVVQAAIQFGNKNQRKIVIKEICDGGRMIELAKSQYAHFVVLKMIKSSVKDSESIRLIVKVRLIEKYVYSFSHKISKCSILY